MSKLPKRFFLQPRGGMNNTIARSLPDSQPQESLPAQKGKKPYVIQYAWELTPEEILDLKEFYRVQNLEYDAQIWVQEGDDPITMADDSDWNPNAKKN